ncbi:MAG: hypothetical protein KAS32_29340 [Candidatus Peribacteraceae bacterium]|nr:hypothetical protein [Candidatus Peribacteraceae bacterium]
MTDKLSFIVTVENLTRSAFKSIGKGLARLGRGALNVGKSFFNAGKRIVQFTTAAVAAFGVMAVKIAADADEIDSKFKTVFKDSLSEADAAVKELTKSYGINSTTAKKLLADTGDLLSGFGFTEQQALELSITTNKLAVDLASFTNIEGGTEKASVALTKALLGESEQAKALGIVIRQDSKEYIGLVKNAQKVKGVSLLQAKAMAAITIATKQSKNAIGDYARTSSSLANQMKLVKERFNAFTIEIGRQIIKGAGLGKTFTDLARGIGNFTARLRESKAVEKFVERAKKALGPLIDSIKGLFEGGEKRDIAIAKFKEIGKDFATRAAEVFKEKILPIAEEMGAKIVAGILKAPFTLPFKFGESVIETSEERRSRGQSALASGFNLTGQIGKGIGGFLSKVTGEIGRTSGIGGRQRGLNERAERDSQVLERIAKAAESTDGKLGKENES